jgi:hypothetical protein
MRTGLCENGVCHRAVHLATRGERGYPSEPRSTHRAGGPSATVLDLAVREPTNLNARTRTQRDARTGVLVCRRTWIWDSPCGAVRN